MERTAVRGRLEDATISDILYSFGQGNFIFIRETLGNLKSDVFGNRSLNDLPMISFCVFFFACQVFGFDGSTTIQEFSETINRVSQVFL